jgi:hypothetical protein
MKQFANTETKHGATLPPKGQSAESPKGLGIDGNKPLMKNRWPVCPASTTGITGGNILNRRVGTLRAAADTASGQGAEAAMGCTAHVLKL